VKSQRISWPMLLTACALGALIRVLWMTNVHSVPVSDFAYYLNKGISLANGQGYTSGGVPTAFWPPGYPIFLAGVFKVFGGSLEVAKATNIVLWTATTVLVYLLGLRLDGRATAAVAAFTVALFPEFILFANLVSSENLFIPLVLGSALILSPKQKMSGPPNWKRSLLAGLLLGFAVVVRTTAVLLPPLMALILMLWYRSRPAFISACLLIAAFAISPAAWVVRNAVVMGSPVLSTNGGISLWTGNNPLATGGYRLKGTYPPRDISTPANELAANSAYTKEAITFVVTQPGQFIALVPEKAKQLFAKPATLGWNTAANVRGASSSYSERQLTAAEKRAVRIAVAIRANRGGWMKALWAVGLIGLLLAVLQRRSVGVWIGSIVGYWLLFHVTLGNGQPRYLVSVAPAVAVCASFLAVTVVRWTAGALGMRRGQ
jgi:4-amino-4-deoxy-L-arabinose transferase-like glycosyltransferase